MTKAIWNVAVLAESDACRTVERNYYFPANAVKREYLRPSEHHTTCFWKGKASYYDVVVNGEVNQNAAWYYTDPEPAARQIKNYIAFWHGVTVVPA
jgi:uncharacterized protein (DUF427 family)